MQNFKHQGDVTFAEAKWEKIGEIAKHDGSFVLALGETTGHKHVITVEKATDMEIRRLHNNEFLMTLLAPATVTHEEHLPITLQPGTYRVGAEREVDHFSQTIRQVID